LSKVEFESFVKGFLLFFSSLSILISTLFYLNYSKDIKTLDETLFTKMRVCSYDLECKNFKIDFEPIKNQELYKLHKSPQGLKSYFPVGAKKYYLVLMFENSKYKELVYDIQSKNITSYLIIIGVILLLSILFSIYTLSPLRSALSLTHEFIKDILHDFNTPISSLKLNSFMLKREIGENEKIIRIEQSLQSILSLEENLKAYLFDYEQTKELVDVENLIKDEVSLIEKNYTDIKFIVDIKNLKIEINRSAFARVCENILTNAAKYNKQYGKVSIVYDEKTKKLSFIDTGKGIKNSSKIFDRFYKEQDRGIGIGLHIVKKLCDELKIGIEVESEVGKGTNFTLLLTKW
jgi:signal transduction histidine kinase